MASRSDEPRADSLEISRFLPSFLGKMAVFDKTESLCKQGGPEEVDSLDSFDSFDSFDFFDFFDFFDSFDSFLSEMVSKTL